MSSNNYQKFAASEHPQMAGVQRLHDSDPSEQIEVSVYLKPNHPNRTERETREAREARRAQDHANDIKVVEDFALAHNLRVTSVQAGRRLVKLAGTVAQMNAAFQTSIGVYGDGQKQYRAHTDSLSLPEDVLPVVESVLGIDTREVAQPRLVVNHASAETGHWPNAVGALYGFPTTGNGAGQCIAIIELGGGYIESDITSEFAAMGLKPPVVVPVSVDGGKNDMSNTDADGEVALDIQVAGGVAPGARLAVYFTPNTNQGFADAITQASNDTTNKPSVISISWGGPEANWSPQTMTTMNTALQDAATLGISVFVASGDNLSTDGLSNGRVNCDFPASSPWAIGCGGTAIVTSGNTITSESVWNSGSDGSGGGISDAFPVPSFQANANLPVNASTGKTGRGVPDVSGNGDPSSGYTIYVQGAEQQVGGTSAVAPLWAGLAALINQQSAQSIGFFLPTLYANPSMVRTITKGNNIPSNFGKGYDATNGWSGCAGLGVPIGEALMSGLKQAAKATTSVG